MWLSCFSCVFFVKQKTAYEMRISDWSSDVCSSDLRPRPSADLPCRKDAQRQKHKEDDECEDEQELGDSCGRARNAAEPQKSGNHCDNGENQCPFRSEERRVGQE